MLNKFQNYSQLGVAIDLISNHYDTKNPIIIAEKIENDLNLNYTIHQICDYLDITNTKNEDYEKNSREIEYKNYY